MSTQQYPLLREYERLLEITKDEVLGASINVKFNDRMDAMTQGSTLFYECTHGRYGADEAALIHRKLEEQDYYTWLLLGLTKQHAEISVNDPGFDINTTRRLIFTNTECISFIQILLRDDEIHLHVHQRSSLLTDCLPTDLEQYTEIAYKFFDKINDCKDEKALNLQVSFGSLHRNS